MNKIEYVIQNKSGSNGSYNLGKKQFTIIPGEVVRIDTKPTGYTVNVKVSRVVTKNSEDSMKPLNMIPVENESEESKDEPKGETTTKKK